MPKLPSAKERPSREPSELLLASMLQLAVPLWIEQLKSAGWDHILQRARQCSQVVAEKGDVILFRGKKKGESAAAFNALAEGIACLAFAPGGVKCFGGHWEACQKEDGPKRLSEVLITLCSAIERSLQGGKDA